MDALASQYRERLLIEVIADHLGFETVVENWLERGVYPPYLYFGFFIVFDFAVLNTYKHLTGGTHALLANPTWIAIPTGLVLGVVGIRYMSDGYAQAIADLRVHDRIDEADLAAFERTVPLRAKVIVYVLGLGLFFGHMLVNRGITEIVAYEGLVPGAIAYLFLMPFVYLPLVVEFTLVYLSIHFFVPRRIDRADIGLFFYDPRNMGGFGSIGQLLKRSYYLYTGGLLLYLLVSYGPYVLSQFATVPLPAPGLFAAAFFSAAWLVGILSIAHSMVILHRIMSAEREERIRELEAEIREIVDDPYDINASEIVDQEQLADVRRRIERVRETKVYPATFTMWSQLAISVLLPQVIQVAVQTTA